MSDTREAAVRELARIDVQLRQSRVARSKLLAQANAMREKVDREMEKRRQAGVDGDYLAFAETRRKLDEGHHEQT